MPGEIEATSVGVCVPIHDFRAVVHSVFQTALNMSVIGQDRLLTVFTSNNTDLPQGIRLPPGSEWFLQGRRTGDAVTCEAGVLRFNGSDTSIRLEGARRYTSEVADLQMMQPSAGGKAAWKFAFEVLAERQQEKQADVQVSLLLQGEATVAANVYARQIRGLIVSSRQRDPAGLAAAVMALTGLGGGLTPAGDDVLVGFLAGMLATRGDDPGRGAWLAGLGRLMRETSRATNDISRSYLLLAVEEQFSGSLSTLAALICRGAAGEAVRQAAEVVFETGFTSGMDAATGLLAGLAVYNEDLLAC